MLSTGILLQQTTTSLTGTWTMAGARIPGVAANNYLGTGNSISLNAAGDIVALGSFGNSEAGVSRGHTRIFQWSGYAWIQLGSSINGDRNSDNSGFSVSLNNAGNRVAIGAEGNDINGNNSGHTRIFEWNGLAWNQLGGAINGKYVSDRAGHSVSLNSVGNRVAISSTGRDMNPGATQSNIANQNRGAIDIYEWVNGAWTQMGGSVVGDAGGDILGLSVSLNNAGNIVAAGAIESTYIGSQEGPGYVKILQYDGANWVQLGANINGTDIGSNFGASVSINDVGDIVAVLGGTPTTLGFVRVFQWKNGAWIQIGIDINSSEIGDALQLVATGATGGSFHSNLSINAAGDVIVVGWRGANINGMADAGRACAYQWDGATWNQVGADINGENTEDHFGATISINGRGNRIAVGAPLYDNNGSYRTGYARIFDLL